MENKLNEVNKELKLKKRSVGFVAYFVAQGLFRLIFCSTFILLTCEINKIKSKK